MRKITNGYAISLLKRACKMNKDSKISEDLIRLKVAQLKLGRAARLAARYLKGVITAEHLTEFKSILKEGIQK